MLRIPKDAVIIGEIRFSDPIRFDGKIKGDGMFDKLVLVSDTCAWTGKIVSDEIIIEGFVDGDIYARKKLQISSSAHVKGSIKAPEMIIAKGAKLEATVNMQKEKPVPIAKPSKKETAKTGSREKFTPKIVSAS